MNEIPHCIEQKTLMGIYSFAGGVAKSPALLFLPPSNILYHYLTNEHSIKIDFYET